MCMRGLLRPRLLPVGDLSVDMPAHRNVVSHSNGAAAEFGSAALVCATGWGIASGAAMSFNRRFAHRGSAPAFDDGRVRSDLDVRCAGDDVVERHHLGIGMARGCHEIGIDLIGVGADLAVTFEMGDLPYMVIGRVAQDGMSVVVGAFMLPF